MDRKPKAYKNIFSILLGGLVVFCSCIVSSKDTSGLDELRIPYESENGISVISGTGKTILDLSAKRAVGEMAKKDWSGDWLLEYGYFAPDVHPAQDRLVCLRYHHFFEQQRHDARCDLVEISLKKGKPLIQTVYTPPADRNIASPIWSPDGRHIAFFQFGKHGMPTEVTILHKEDGRIGKRFALQEAKASVHFDYLRWSADGRKLFVRVGRLPPENMFNNEGIKTSGLLAQDVGILKVDSGSVQWLGQWMGTGRYGIQQINGKSPEESKFEYGEWKQKIESPEDSEALETLFGSGENKVDHPVWSPDRRYYFCERYKDGFWANGWVERYDTQTKKRVRIKTIWWAPYRD